MEFSEVNEVDLQQNDETLLVEESTSRELNFTEQVEAALCKHLPSDDGIDNLIEKIVETYLTESRKKYDDDFFFDIIKPIIVQIIRLKDDLEKDIRTLNNEINNKSDVNKIISFAQDVLESTNDSITDIIEFYDVNPYKVDGKEFDPLKQTTIKTIPTDDTSLFKVVVESFSHGYERNGKIISKERVSAYTVNSQQN